MKKNNKGFTLAELLIVVAIIAVLVAVAIPVFTTQLRKAELATDLANVRGAFADQVATKMADNKSTDYDSSGNLIVTITGVLNKTTCTSWANGKIVLQHSKAPSVTGSFSYDTDIKVTGVA